LKEAFAKRLRDWATNPSSRESPPILDSFFILDFLLVLGLIVVGKELDLRLEEFAFLLFANTVVWSAYIGGGRRQSRLFFGVLLMVPLVSALLLLGIRIELGEPRWFFLILHLGPLMGMTLVTVFSVLMVSLLRATEHHITQEHLQLLGKYEDMLSTAVVKVQDSDGTRGEQFFSERQFDKQVLGVLKDLCSLGRPFWYHKACLWFIEHHKDLGEIAIPGPRFRFPEADKYRNGTKPPTVFINFSTLILLHPRSHRAVNLETVDSEFRPPSNAPAAVIPLRTMDVKRAVLALYGEELGPPIPRQEEAFLRSLGSIFSNSMEQWASRYKVFPQTEMDELFKCRSLEEVFPLAVGILKRYLMASGCMVIFRRDPKKKEMEIVATEGFTDSIYNNHYEAGRGQTGSAAQLGQLTRFDDVSTHREKFDSVHLRHLIKTHGRPITSWMAIPIGPRENNYGVIKVVNSEFRSHWFTDYDERIAEELALRLHVIIEKFLHIKETEDASAESKRQAQIAEEHANDALFAKRRAEAGALQRQQDLLTITHQVQGPLIPVIGILSSLSQAPIPRVFRERLEHAQALVEDAFTLCYGTFTTFAVEAEQKPASVEESINAPAELRKLSQRLKRTNSRPDLNFTFKDATDFPILNMDRNIFTSVFYSLIHNAMKYANESSNVTLECGFEEPGRKPVLKVRSYG
ncbi:MAG TPA: GAF domain-containing protein, partial [Anaerolineales bacterium]|nr:GAF domain-containing protein [Anaerolineales bacterium]